jgi:hypothetical protein
MRCEEDVEVLRPDDHEAGFLAFLDEDVERLAAERPLVIGREENDGREVDVLLGASAHGIGVLTDGGRGLEEGAGWRCEECPAW